MALLFIGLLLLGLLAWMAWPEKKDTLEQTLAKNKKYWEENPKRNLSIQERGSEYSTVERDARIKNNRVNSSSRQDSSDPLLTLAMASILVNANQDSNFNPMPMSDDDTWKGDGGGFSGGGASSSWDDSSSNDSSGSSSDSSSYDSGSSDSGGSYDSGDSGGGGSFD